jgi:hypothetical protein
MLRKTFIIIPIVLLALTGCSTRSKETAGTVPQSPAVGAPSAGAAGQDTATPAACPTKATRKLAKTRFVSNAGLAAGAFKRYIYAPYQKGSFKSGAPKQKRSIVKAAAAGLFVLDQLRRAKANAQADPTLCKALVTPLTTLSSSMSGLVGKLKQGQVDPTDIATTSGGVEGFRRVAGGAGAGFKDKDVPSNMIGG